MTAILAALMVAASPLTPRPVLAVAYFDNDSAQRSLDPLRKGLADLLIGDLSNAESVQVVERERLEAVVAELALQQTAKLNRATTVKVGKLLAAQFIVTGAFQVQGRALRVDARLIEVATGAVAATARVEGTQAEFFALAKDLVDVVVKALRLPLTVAERQKLRESQTESWEAFQRYSRALDAVDQQQPEQARAEFERALAADPGYRRARDASGRLEALLGQALTQQDAESKAKLAALKVGDPELDLKLFHLINEVQLTTDAAHIELRAAVLEWIFAHRSRPRATSRDPKNPFFYFEAQNLFLLVNNYADDPVIAPRIPAVRAYLLGKYRGETSVEGLLDTTVPPTAAELQFDSFHGHYVAARGAVERLTALIAASLK